MLVNNLVDSPDNIYFNITMTNNSTITEELATYTATKTIPLVNNTTDYYLSVVSFSIPLDDVPITICPIVPNQGNPNLTPLIIGIRDFTGSTTYFQNLIYTPTLADQPIPAQTSTTPVITPYYYMYSYETLINMMNAALLVAYNAFKVVNPGSTHLCPFFIYDASTTLISLIADNTWNSTTSGQSVVCNRALYKFFDSIPFKTFSPTLPNAIGDICLQVYNMNNNGYPINTFPIVPAYYRMSTNYSTMFLWSSLKKLLITTNSLPINYEQAPTYNNQNPDQFNSIPILADFTPSISAAGDSREIAFYTSTIFRLIDLKASGPLNKLNFNILWQDTYNNTYPLFISPFQEVTLKFILTKKSLYKKS